MKNFIIANQKERDVILIIRRNKEYWLRNEYKNTLNARLIDIMDMWNQSFNLNIIDYRNRLRDIASSLYMKNKFDKIFLHSEKDPRRLRDFILKEEKNLYKDSIFVPIDEDDWICSQLSDELRYLQTNKSIFIWNYFVTFKEKEVKSNNGEGMRFVQSCMGFCRV